MVHTFDCLNRQFALDTESGTILEIDDAVRATIHKMQSPDAAPAGEFFACRTMTEAEAEVRALVEAGVLFSSLNPVKKRPFDGAVKALCLNISHLCNLSCSYCFADGGAYRGKTACNMPYETAIAAVEYLIERSSRKNLEIDFFGGEPLMNREVLKDTVRYIRRRERECGKTFLLTVTTNAMSLDDDAIDFFNREMHNVVVSIDGRKHVHNHVRKTPGGGDSFDRVLQNALHFKDRRVGQYYIRGTFTANNLDFADDVFFLNDLGFDKLSVEPVVLSAGHPLAIKSEHLPKVCAEYERLAAEYIERRRTNVNLQFFHFMLDIYNPPCKDKLTRGCGAGCEYLAVSPDGGLYPCHQFDGAAEYLLGSVLDKTCRTDLPQRFWETDVTTKPDCRSCWAKYHCGGGCNANAALIGGNMSVPDSVTCAMMRKRIECAIAVAATEKT